MKGLTGKSVSGWGSEEGLLGLAREPQLQFLRPSPGFLPNSRMTQTNKNIISRMEK